jgi:hypothetical protein
MRAFAADDEPKIIPHFIPQLRPYKGSLASSKHVAGDDEPQPNCFRFLLKPRRDINRIAEDRKLQARLVADRAAKGVADVQADADEDGESMGMET